MWIVVLASGCANPNVVGDDVGVDGGISNDGGESDAASEPATITVTLNERTYPLDRFVAAYQDGSNAWALAEPPTADTFTFVVTSPRWSFAWACEGVAGDGVWAYANVLSYAVSEKTSVTVPEDCPRSWTGIHLRGTVSGTIPGSRYATAWGELETSVGARIFDTSYDYEIRREKAGTHDLYAAALETTGTTSTTSAVAIVRGVSAYADTSNVNISMSDALATPAEHPVTIHGITSERTNARTTLYDASGTMLFLAGSNFAPPHVTRGIAPSQLLPGSVHEQRVEAYLCPDATNVAEWCDGRIVEHWRSTVGAQTVTLPPRLGAVTTTAHGRAIRATWAPYPSAVGYTWYAHKYYEVLWRGTIGAGYAGDTPAFEIPDLSSLPGWEHFIPEPNGDAWIFGVVRAFVSPAGSTDFPFSYPAPAGTERLRLEAPIKLRY